MPRSLRLCDIDLGAMHKDNNLSWRKVREVLHLVDPIGKIESIDEVIDNYRFAKGSKLRQRILRRGLELCGQMSVRHGWLEEETQDLIALIPRSWRRERKVLEQQFRTSVQRWIPEAGAKDDDDEWLLDDLIRLDFPSLDTSTKKLAQNRLDELISKKIKQAKNLYDITKIQSSNGVRVGKKLEAKRKRLFQVELKTMVVLRELSAFIERCQSRHGLQLKGCYGSAIRRRLKSLLLQELRKAKSLEGFGHLHSYVQDEPMTPRAMVNLIKRRWEAHSLKMLKHACTPGYVNDVLKHSLEGGKAEKACLTKLASYYIRPPAATNR